MEKEKDLDQEQVMKRFALYRGLTIAQSEPDLPLVQDAIEQLEGMRRKGIAGGEALLCAAAAALANWQKTLLECSENFSAGEFRVSPADSSAARQMWQQALRAAAPWLQDREFLFRRMG